MSGDVLRNAFRLFVGDSSSDSDLLEETLSSEYTDDEDLPVDQGTMTETPARIVVLYGEVYVAYRGIEDVFEVDNLGPSHAFSRSLEGPELELGLILHSEWNLFVEFFTVIPKGAIGNSVVSYMKQKGLKLRLSRTECEFGPIADFTEMVSEDIQPVYEFQRSGSAFNRAKKPFRWDKGIIHDRAPCWVHSSLASFIWSDTGKENWIMFMESLVDPHVQFGDILVSVELCLNQCVNGDPNNFANRGVYEDQATHELQLILGFIQPYMSRISLLILTYDEFSKISQIVGTLQPNPDSSKKEMESLLKNVRKALDSFAIAVIVPKTDTSKVAIAVCHKDLGVAWTNELTTPISDRQLIAKLIGAWTKGPVVTTIQHLTAVLQDVWKSKNDASPPVSSILEEPDSSKNFRTSFSRKGTSVLSSS